MKKTNMDRAMSDLSQKILGMEGLSKKEMVLEDL